MDEKEELTVESSTILSDTALAIIVWRVHFQS